MYACVRICAVLTDNFFEGFESVRGPPALPQCSNMQVSQGIYPGGPNLPEYSYGPSLSPEYYHGLPQYS